MRHDGTATAGSRAVTAAFSRKLLLGLFGGTLLMAATLFTTWWMARAQDEAVRATSHRMVAGGIETLVERANTTLLDYALWTDAFDHVVAGDVAWMSDNIGASTETDTFDVAVILPPHGGRPIGWEGGEGPLPGGDLLGADALAAASALLATAPVDSGDGYTTYVRKGDGAWLLAAARIVPQDGVPAWITDADAPRLIVAVPISTASMHAIASRFAISDLTVDAGPRPERESMPLAGSDGRPVAWVNWSAPTPGRMVLEAALWPLVALMAAVSIVALLVSRELMRSARRLEAALDQARAADRMKTEFLGNVSHELRTPLNGVIGIAQLLQLRAKEPECLEMLDLLLAAARSQLQLVNGLLDITRIETGTVTLDAQPFDPAAALEETVGLIAPEIARKTLELNVTVAPELRRPFLGDALAFQQVVANLVGNALKFTEQGGITVSLLPAEAGLTLVVSDTGVGIDPGEHERIFERFVQVDGSATRRAGGAGLGLAITRALIDLMDGTVQVSSTPGEGSCFTVTLPLRPAGGLASAA